jgi:hypothetical protein
VLCFRVGVIVNSDFDSALRATSFLIPFIFQYSGFIVSENLPKRSIQPTDNVIPDQETGYARLDSMVSTCRILFSSIIFLDQY